MPFFRGFSRCGVFSRENFSRASQPPGGSTLVPQGALLAAPRFRLVCATFATCGWIARSARSFAASRCQPTTCAWRLYGQHGQKKCEGVARCTSRPRSNSKHFKANQSENKAISKRFSIKHTPFFGEITGFSRFFYPSCPINESGKVGLILKIRSIGADTSGTSANPIGRRVRSAFRIQRTPQCPSPAL